VAAAGSGLGGDGGFEVVEFTAPSGVGFAMVVLAARDGVGV
jgi:hypothetical protein